MESIEPIVWNVARVMFGVWAVCALCWVFGNPKDPERRLDVFAVTAALTVAGLSVVVASMLATIHHRGALGIQNGSSSPICAAVHFMNREISSRSNWTSGGSAQN